MALHDVALEVIWLAGIAAAFPQLHRAWRDRSALAKLESIWQRFWPYGETALQGWLRAQVALYVAALLMSTYPAAVLLPTATGSTRTALALVTLVGAFGIALMLGLAILIILLNVPKFLVFPALRDQEGLLVQWWRRRRASQS